MQTEFELMVAPTGARLSKSDHPALPITASEIVKTAQDCAQAGATAIHVHVRTDDGGHSLDPERYANVLSKLHTATNLSVQISTEAAGIFDVATQRHCLIHCPCSDASVSLREIQRAPELSASIYQIMQNREIDVQHILYDAADLDMLLTLFTRREIDTRSQRAIFVLGRYSTDQIASPDDLKPFLRRLGNSVLNWSVCAFGHMEQACLLAALNEGGDVRIGFENNFHAPNGTVFPDNAASVVSFVEAADKYGFQPKQVMS